MAYGYVPARIPDYWPDSPESDVYLPDTGDVYKVAVTAPAWRDLWPWLIGAAAFLLLMQDSKKNSSK